VKKILSAVFDGNAAGFQDGDMHGGNVIRRLALLTQQEILHGGVQKGKNSRNQAL